MEDTEASSDPTQVTCNPAQRNGHLNEVVLLLAIVVVVLSSSKDLSDHDCQPEFVPQAYKSMTAVSRIS